mmetsp:Transcript_3183/g.12195  ORF Transcript_3183/g.12195 Transcript_3183/m.12195 type:complete len:91 (+) Transcript_3183:2119-2391(+)
MWNWGSREVKMRRRGADEENIDKREGQKTIDSETQGEGNDEQKEAQSAKSPPIPQRQGYTNASITPTQSTHFNAHNHPENAQVRKKWGFF